MAYSYVDEENTASPKKKIKSHFHATKHIQDKSFTNKELEY